MALTKITQEDTNDKGVIGLADTPNLSTQAMQEKFDELALDVIVPKHNELVDDLEAGTAASCIGALKNGEATTVQDYLDAMSAGGYTKEEADVLLAGKVDKEEGKGLSTFDFSEGYKEKLNGIEDEANNYVLPPATHDSLGGIKPDNTTTTVDVNGFLHAIGGGGGGNNNYEALINLPLWNGKVVFGDQPSEYYGVLRPYVKVTSDAGSTVTITKGTETITLTQVSGSTTEWEGYPTSYGTWTVKSVLSGADDATTSLTVDAVKTYAVTVNHISATITVTYPNGADCKLSKGTLEYTATTNPQTFTVRSVGTWTVTCTYNGIVKTATAIISADGDSQSVTIEYASIVVNYGNDFKGKTITCTDGDLTYTKVAPNDASSISFTIPSTGTWTVSATVSGTPYSVNQSVSSYTTYTVTLEVFNATVTITFPYTEGGTCTISDGDTTLTATESPMAFSIPNTGTWVATCTLDGQSKTQSFSITTDGQTESHTFEYGTINLTYANEFRGVTLTCSSGGTTISKVAPVGANSMVFYPPSTGTWTITGVYSGVTYSSGSITVSSLSTPVSAILQTVPDGSTVTPTDNIQKWLKCAGINDKNYTTLAEVLADSTTLLALLSDNNANDYLVRSKTFTTASGLVPNMTSNTTPSGECSCNTDGTLDNAAWESFSPTGGSNQAGTYGNGSYMRNIYKFTSAVCVKKFKFQICNNSAIDSTNIKLQGSNNGTNWTDLSSAIDTTGYSRITDYSFNANNSNSYQYYALYIGGKGTAPYIGGLIKIQFYATTENAGLCDNSTAMTDIGANNYCANTLLADSTWCSAIAGSTYYESVLNKKIPTMTSNTQPSGTITTSDNNTEDAYKGFNNNDGDGFLGGASTTFPWNVEYQFASAIKFPSKFKLITNCVAYSFTNVKYKVQLYDTTTSAWVDVAEYTENYTTSETKTKNFDKTGFNHSYSKIRYSMVSVASRSGGTASFTGYGIALYTLQVYGR